MRSNAQKNGGHNKEHWLYSPASQSPIYIRLLPELRRSSISETFRVLIQEATKDHGTLIAAANAEHLIRRDGYRDAYRSQSGIENGRLHAERLSTQYGVGFRILDGRELATEEPNLRIQMAGAVHWTDA